MSAQTNQCSGKNRKILAAFFVLLLFSALVRLASCRKYFFIDEIHILRNLNRFVNLRTLVPSDFCYPTLYSYLSLPPTLAGSSLLYLTGELPSASAIMSLHDLNSTLPILPARLTSVLFALATIYLVYKIGEKFFNREAALAAAAILSFSLLHVRLSGYAKLDVTMTFFAALTLLATLTASESGSARHFVLASVCAALTVTTKYNGAFVLVPLMLVHVLQLKNQGRLWSVGGWFNKKVLLSGLAFTAVFLAGTPTWLIDPRRTWYSMWYMLNYNTAGQAVSFGTTHLRYLVSFWTWEKTSALLFGLGFLHAVYRRSRKDWILLCFITTSFLCLGSNRKIALHYLLFLFPALSMLAGEVLSLMVSRLEKRTLQFLLLAAVLAWPVYSSVSYAHQQFREDSRVTAYRWIQDNIEAGSTIILDKGYLPALLTTRKKEALVTGKYKDFFKKKLKSVATYETTLITYDVDWLNSVEADYLLTNSHLYTRYMGKPTPMGNNALSREHQKKKTVYEYLLREQPDSAWKKVTLFNTGRGPQIILFTRRQ